MAPDDPPTPKPPAPTPNPAPTAPPAPPDPDEIRMTKDQLSERLARANKAHLKKLGFESEEELAARVKELDDLKKQEDERKKAAMTEVERERAARAEAERLAQANAAAAAAAQEELAVHRLATANGVTQVDYLRFKIDAEERAMDPEARKAHDRGAFVKKLLAEPRERIALGLDAPPVAGAPAPTPVPAGTVPKPGVPAPNPPGAGVPPPAKTAMDMTDAEWTARKAQLGIA